MTPKGSRRPSCDHPVTKPRARPANRPQRVMRDAGPRDWARIVRALPHQVPQGSARSRRSRRPPRQLPLRDQRQGAPDTACRARSRRSAAPRVAYAEPVARSVAQLVNCPAAPQFGGPTPAARRSHSSRAIVPTGPAPTIPSATQGITRAGNPGRALCHESSHQRAARLTVPSGHPRPRGRARWCDCSVVGGAAGACRMRAHAS